MGWAKLMYQFLAAETWADLHYNYMGWPPPGRIQNFAKTNNGPGPYSTYFKITAPP